MNRLQRLVALPRVFHAASAGVTRGYRKKAALRPAPDLLQALKAKQDVGVLAKDELKDLCSTL